MKVHIAGKCPLKISGEGGGGAAEGPIGTRKEVNVSVCGCSYPTGLSGGYAGDGASLAGAGPPHTTGGSLL